MAKSVKDLRVAIVGAGIGGLTTALALARRGFTDISIYEIASNLGFVGAGIQLAPNMARVLDTLDCWAPIEKEAVDLKSTSIRKGESDEELGHVDLRYIREAYGYPHMVGHRSSLVGAIYAACQQEKSIKFHFQSNVGEKTSFSPTAKFKVQPRSGEAYEVEADILVGADGVKSATRQQILRELHADADVQDTKQAAYRILLTREQVKDDSELLELIDGDKVTRWVGEKRHIIAYPIANKSIYNISTAQPDTNFAAAPSATYTTKGSKVDMLKVFEDFCPKIQRMLNLVPEGEVCEWKLRVHAPLPTWTHGSAVLIGDACHPTLPHLAQGAALSIEDAAVLGVALSRLPDCRPESISKAFKVYESLRKERAEALVELAAASGRSLHLGEGKAKEERDRLFKELRGKKGGAVPDKWADADVQRQIYGYDSVKVAEEEFDGIFANL